MIFISRSLPLLDNSIDSLDNIEILSTDVGNGAYRSLTALLSIIIPTLVNKEPPVISRGNVIKLKLGGDGREVGRSNHHVMFTVCILNEENDVLDPAKQHCICLYTGIEKFESLQLAFEIFIDELKQLVNQGFEDSERNFWKVDLWFSSDWKFMALILGINGPTDIIFVYIVTVTKMNDRIWIKYELIVKIHKENLKIVKACYHFYNPIIVYLTNCI
ncbi:hypothetical protein F8M41_007185 [Gigaspora margarita]|uniref:Uncharacterized protein n=1 Tax=Gigaspora margarita TaxID=4874 RepID=A0A8H4A3J8_GIGMA|nr:hypothetical protein F8M41_007185 [Gigaspora margarita]